MELQPPALLQQGQQLLRRQRPAEEVALQLLAAAGAQELQLLAGLDAFGHDLELEAGRQWR